MDFARATGSKYCFGMSRGRRLRRLNRSNHVPYASTANIHKYDDQGSPYDIPVTHSDCDSEEEDLGFVSVAPALADLHLEVLAEFSNFHKNPISFGRLTFLILTPGMVCRWWRVHGMVGLR